MEIFGHPGLTLGTALLLKTALAGSRSHQAKTTALTKYPEPVPKWHLDKDASASSRSRLLTFLEKIDVRLLLVGSLLPDIIDKPLGTFFLRDIFSSGRIFCHTLVFLLVITLAGFYLYRSHGKIWLLTLSFGTFTHLICDQMWGNLPTLLWPVYGLTFKRDDISHWIQDILYGLYTDPRMYVPELVGLLILVWFALTLVRQRKFQAFCRNGRVLYQEVI